MLAIRECLWSTPVKTGLQDLSNLRLPKPDVTGQLVDLPADGAANPLPLSLTWKSAIGTSNYRYLSFEFLRPRLVLIFVLSSNFRQQKMLGNLRVWKMKVTFPKIPWRSLSVMSGAFWTSWLHRSLKLWLRNSMACLLIRKSSWKHVLSLFLRR